MDYWKFLASAYRDEMDYGLPERVLRGNSADGSVNRVERAMFGLKMTRQYRYEHYSV